MNTCNDVNAGQVLNAYGKTDGHDLIRQGTFPRGSILKEGVPGEAPWRCTGGELAGFDYMEGSEGGRYPYVRVRKNQRLWQDIQLPAKAESRTDYQLGVEYNAGNFKECTVYVYRLEDGQPQGPAFFTHLLKGAGELPLDNADPAWATLALTSIQVPTDATAIRVVFETPNPDNTAYLYLKQTQSWLKLPALGVDTELRLTVDPDGQKLVHPNGDLAFCHGATHRLEVKAPDGDAWLNLPISLLWLQDDSLPGDHGLSAVPPFNRNNGSQEEFYQDLSPSKETPWALHANGGAAAPSGDVMLGVGSFHIADKFPLPAQLGDFRFEVKNLQWDGETPIVDLGNSTVLTATVVSPFDNTRVQGNKKVEWWLNGSHYKDEVTDGSGTTKLVYTPRKGEGGTGNSATFTVKCVDAYEKPSEQSLAVKVYDTTPWLVDLEVLLDDKPIDDLGGLSLPLTPGGNRKLTLKPKPGSYFLDKDISLGWRETGPQLGITFTPNVAQKVTPEGISWSIKGGNEKGLFTLEAKASGLQVGLELKGVQMSTNLADEATLEYTSRGDEPKFPIFLRQTPGTVSIVPNADSPLGTLGLEATLTFLKTGALTEQQLPAAPAYGTGAAITEKGHTWSLEGKGVSGTFGLEVSVPGFTGTLKLDKAALMSNVVSDEADVTLAGSAPDSQVVIHRNKDYTLSIKPKAGSPLGETGVQSWVQYVKGSVAKDKLTLTPTFDNKRSINADGLTWTLKGASVSGTFDLMVHINSFNTMLALDNNILLSDDLNDEIELVPDNELNETLPVFRRGVGQEVRVKAKAGSPVALVKFKAKLAFVKNGDLLAADVPAAPAYDSETSDDLTAWHWKLTGTQKSGTFGLAVHAEGFSKPATLAKAVLLSTALSDEIELVPDDELIWTLPAFRRGVAQEVRVKAKAGSPVAQVKFTAKLVFVKNGDLLATDVPATPAYDSETSNNDLTAKHWRLTGTQKSGTFGLAVHAEGFSTPATLAKAMLLSTDLGDEVELVTAGEVGTTGLPIFRRGVRRPVRVNVKPGSPIGSERVKAAFVFEKNGELTAADVTADPIYEGWHTNNLKNFEWRLTGAAKSGTFGCALKVEGFSAPAKLPKAVLLSTVLSDEAELTVTGGASVPIFWRDRAQNVRIVPKSTSPLGEAGLKATLAFVSTNSLTASQIPATPAYGAPSAPLTTGGQSWSLRGAKDKSGTFGLKATVEGFTSALELKTCGLLALKIGDEISYQGKGSSFIARGGSRELSFNYVPAHLIALGAKFWVEFRGAAPGPQVMSASPNFDAQVSPQSNGVSTWRLTASPSISGEGNPVFCCTLYPDQSIGAGFLIVHSTRVRDDLNFLVDGRELSANDWSAGMYLNVTSKRLTARLNGQGFQTAAVNVSLTVQRTSGGNVTSNPASGTVVSIGGNSAWSVVKDQISGVGQFKFKFHYYGEEVSLDSLPYR